MSPRQRDTTGSPNPFWKPVIPSRRLNDWEHAVIARLMEQDFAGYDLAARQLASAIVTHTNETDPSVLIEVDHDRANRLADANRGPLYSLVSESYGYDADGMIIFAQQKMIDGFLAKLEVQRGDGSPFSVYPLPEAFAYTSDEMVKRGAIRRL
jgi:hypothetical protein